MRALTGTTAAGNYSLPGSLSSSWSLPVPKRTRGFPSAASEVRPLRREAEGFHDHDADVVLFDGSVEQVGSRTLA